MADQEEDIPWASFEEKSRALVDQDVERWVCPKKNKKEDWEGGKGDKPPFKDDLIALIEPDNLRKAFSRLLKFCRLSHDVLKKRMEGTSKKRAYTGKKESWSERAQLYNDIGILADKFDVCTMEKTQINLVHIAAAFDIALMPDGDAREDEEGDQRKEDEEEEELKQTRGNIESLLDKLDATSKVSADGGAGEKQFFLLRRLQQKLGGERWNELISLPDNDGWLPIHWAVAAGNYDAVGLLGAASHDKHDHNILHSLPDHLGSDGKPVAQWHPFERFDHWQRMEDQDEKGKYRAGVTLSRENHFKDPSGDPVFLLTWQRKVGMDKEDKSPAIDKTISQRVRCTHGPGNVVMMTPLNLAVEDDRTSITKDEGDGEEQERGPIRWQPCKGVEPVKAVLDSGKLRIQDHCILEPQLDRLSSETALAFSEKVKRRHTYDLHGPALTQQAMETLTELGWEVETHGTSYFVARSDVEKRPPKPEDLGPDGKHMTGDPEGGKKGKQGWKFMDVHRGTTILHWIAARLPDDGDKGDDDRPKRNYATDFFDVITRYKDSEQTGSGKDSEQTGSGQKSKLELDDKIVKTMMKTKDIRGLYPWQVVLLSGDKKRAEHLMDETTEQSLLMELDEGPEVPRESFLLLAKRTEQDNDLRDIMDRKLLLNGELRKWRGGSESGFWDCLLAGTKDGTTYEEATKDPAARKAARDVKLESYYKRFVFVNAAAVGDYSLVRDILNSAKQNADTDLARKQEEMNRNALKAAVENGQLQTVREIFRAAPQLSVMAQNGMAISAALSRSDKQMLGLLKEIANTSEGTGREVEQLRLANLPGLKNTRNMKDFQDDFADRYQEMEIAIQNDILSGSYIVDEMLGTWLLPPEKSTNSTKVFENAGFNPTILRGNDFFMDDYYALQAAVSVATKEDRKGPAFDQHDHLYDFLSSTNTSEEPLLKKHLPLGTCAAKIKAANIGFTEAQQQASWLTHFDTCLDHCVEMEKYREQCSAHRYRHDKRRALILSGQPDDEDPVGTARMRNLITMWTELKGHYLDFILIPEQFLEWTHDVDFRKLFENKHNDQRVIKYQEIKIGARKRISVVLGGKSLLDGLLNRDCFPTAEEKEPTAPYETVVDWLKSVGVSDLYMGGTNFDEFITPAAIAALNDGYRVTIIAPGDSADTDVVQKAGGVILSENWWDRYREGKGDEMHDELLRLLVKAPAVSYKYCYFDTDRLEGLRKVWLPAEDRAVTTEKEKKKKEDLRRRLGAKACPYDFGSDDDFARSGELFLFAAARCFKDTLDVILKQSDYFFPHGFVMEGVSVQPSDYVALKHPLHYLIKRAMGTDARPSKLLQKVIHYLNCSAQQLPISSSVSILPILEVDAALHGVVGTVIRVDPDGSTVDVRVPAGEGKNTEIRTLSREALRPTEPFQFSTGRWYNFSGGWIWNLAVDEVTREELFPQGSDYVEESAGIPPVGWKESLQFFGSTAGAAKKHSLTPAEYVASLWSEENAEIILKKMAERSLVILGRFSGYDSTGIPFERDLIRDLWKFATPTGSTGGEDCMREAAPVLHGLFRSLRVLQNHAEDDEDDDSDEDEKRFPDFDKKVDLYGDADWDKEIFMYRWRARRQDVMKKAREEEAYIQKLKKRKQATERRVTSKENKPRALVAANKYSLPVSSGSEIGREIFDDHEAFYERRKEWLLTEEKAEQDPELELGEIDQGAVKDFEVELEDFPAPVHPVGAAKIRVDTVKQESDHYKRLVEMAATLLRTGSDLLKKTESAGRPIQMLKLMDGKHVKDPHPLSRYMSAITDRAGIFQFSSEGDHNDHSHKQFHSSVSGLALLFQVGNNKIFQALDQSKCLLFEKSGYKAQAISAITRSGPVLIQHRHLWRATCGGTETYAFDRGLGLSHWAALRGNSQMLQQIMNGTIGDAGDLNDFLRRPDSESGHGRDAELGYLVPVQGGDIEKELSCAVSRLGYSPLHFAAYSGSSDCVRVILTGVSEEFSEDEFSAFVNLQATQKVEEDTKHLHICTHDLNWIRETMVSDERDRHVLKRLTNRCMYVSTDGNTPLHIAAQFAHVRCAVMLIEAGADVGIRNTLEGVDPHDIALANQYHLELMTGMKRGIIDSAIAEESAGVVVNFIDALDREDDQRETIRNKLRDHSAWHWLQRSSIWYLVFFISLIVVAVMYLYQMETYGSTAIKEHLGQWLKDDCHEMQIDDIGNMGEVVPYLTSAGGGVLTNLFQNDDGDALTAVNYVKPYGSYYLLGAVRVLVLRASEGSCFPRTVRRGRVTDCFGPWSRGNNEAGSKPGGGGNVYTYQDWSGDRPALLNQDLITDVTYSMFPSDSGLVVDFPSWGATTATEGPNAMFNRKILAADLATILSDTEGVRYVAVQINIHDPNSGTTYLTELTFEAPAEGGVYPMAQVTPYRFQQYTVLLDYIKAFFEIVVFSFLIYFVFEEFTDVVQAYRAAVLEEQAIEEEDEPHKDIPWLNNFYVAGVRSKERGIKDRILRGAVQLITMQVLQEARDRSCDETEEIFPVDIYYAMYQVSDKVYSKPRHEDGSIPVEITRTVAEDTDVFEKMMGNCDDSFEWAERRQKAAMLYAISELKSGDLQTDIEFDEYGVVEFEIMTRSKLLWQEIDRIIKAHGLDDADQQESQCLKQVRIFFNTAIIYYTGDSIWNFMDTLVILLVLFSVVGRFVSIGMVANSDSVDQRINAPDYHNIMTGRHYQDLVPLARLEQSIRYGIAGAVVAAGIRFLRHLMYLPKVGPVVTAIIKTILDTQVLTFLLCVMLVILPIWLALHTAFATTHTKLEFSSMFASFFTVWRLFLGDWDFEAWFFADSLAGAIAFFIIVMVLALLFLNLLTGVVGNSYNRLTVQSEKDWATEAEANYIITSDTLDLYEVDDALHDPGILKRSKHREAQAVAFKRRMMAGKLWQFKPVTRAGFENARAQRHRDDLQNVDILDAYRSMYLWKDDDANK